MSQQFLKSTVTYTIGQGLAAAIQMIIVVIAARVLTPDDLGIIGLTDGIAVVIGVLSTMAFPGGLRRLFYKYESTEARALFISTLLRTGLCLTVIVLLVALCTIPFLAPRLLKLTAPNGAYLFALSLVFYVALSSTQYRLVLYQTLEEPAKNAALQMSMWFMIGAGTLMAILLISTNSQSYLEGRLLGIGIVFAWVGWSLYPHLKVGYSREMRQDVVRYSFPLVPNLLLVSLLSFADRYILAMYWPEASVGVYTLAYNLGMAMTLVTGVFTMAWPSVFYPACEARGDHLKKILVLSGKSLAVACSIAILGCLIADDFIAIVFSEDYAGAGKITAIIIVSYFLNFLGMMFAFTIRYAHKTTYIAPITAAVLAFNVLLNFAIIPTWGALGAAWVTLLSMALQSLILLLVAQQIFTLHYPWKSIGLSILLLFLVFSFTQLGWGSEHKLYVYLAGAAVLILNAYRVVMPRSVTLG